MKATATTRTQIEAAETALLQAMRSSNLPLLEELLADDLLFTDHTGRLVDKATDIDAHRSGHIRIDSLEASEQQIRLHGDVAYVSVLLSISGQFFGQLASGRFRFSRLWKKQGKAWQVVAGHSTMLSS